MYVMHRFNNTAFARCISRIIPSEKGLTLVELLIVLPLIGLVAAGIYSFFYTGIGGWMRTTTRLHNQQIARLTVEKVIDSFRFAHNVQEFANDIVPGSQTFVHGGITYHPELHYRDRREGAGTDWFAIYRNPVNSNVYIQRYQRPPSNPGDPLPPPVLIGGPRALAENVSQLGFRRMPQLGSRQYEVFILVGEVGSREAMGMRSSVRPRNVGTGQTM